MNQNEENIVYDIEGAEVISDLPVDTDAKDFIFDFTNFTSIGGDKPFVFYATLTPKKQQSLIDKDIEILKEKDDKMVIFNWNHVIWHYDLTMPEWETMEREESWEEGRIYFVRMDDSEIINGDNFDEKTASFKQIDPIHDMTESQIINEAISLLQRTYRLINERSQS